MNARISRKSERELITLNSPATEKAPVPTRVDVTDPRTAVALGKIKLLVGGYTTISVLSLVALTNGKHLRSSFAANTAKK